MYILDIILIVLASAFTLISLWMLFTSQPKAVLFSGIALLIAILVPEASPGGLTVLFWCLAAIICFIATMLLPESVSYSRVGVPFIAGGALAGAFVGIAIAHAALIVGAAVGAIVGAVAFSRTAAGAVLQFPTRKFFNYLCAKGFQAIIVACVVVIIVLSIIKFFN